MPEESQASNDAGSNKKPEQQANDQQLPPKLAIEDNPLIQKTLEEDNPWLKKK